MQPRKHQQNISQTLWLVPKTLKLNALILQKELRGS